MVNDKSRIPGDHEPLTKCKRHDRHPVWNRWIRLREILLLDFRSADRLCNRHPWPPNLYRPITMWRRPVIRSVEKLCFRLKLFVIRFGGRGLLLCDMLFSLTVKIFEDRRLIFGCILTVNQPYFTLLQRWMLQKGKIVFESCPVRSTK